MINVKSTTQQVVGLLEGSKLGIIDGADVGDEEGLKLRLGCIDGTRDGTILTLGLEEGAIDGELLGFAFVGVILGI